MAAVLNNFVNSFTNRLESPVRQHLKNVYGCLSLSTLSAAAGAYIHLYTELLEANLLTTLGTFGLLFALISTPDNGKNQKLRLSYLLGFAFLSGLGLGPLLHLVISINPSIVITALIGTTVVFVSFSISSLLAERGRWLYLGGTLISLLNIMVLFSILNLFLRWSLFYQAHLYIGLFLMCGFVIYDTQLIIEKYHMGSKDFILHSFDLFIDFISIFRHLLIILTQKEISKEQRKRKN
ncbi:bax Inhibitor-1 [Osmia lignaria lignaria]|uniref:bax Inhibitor-1 n=1 Tax=Osmia lignaria lignaria TaxID=1437193 RepID=UPI0010F7DF10|nr:probable Bax inhibitor 1 [Osmia lignaria]XP_046143959.1 probable Bax inhibitor 1 [Osmia bicornis bicornis]XP_046143960.1 probable Bax inhibitor 1 [Osmia bicornis bicornis]